MGARVVALGLGPGDGTLDASVRTRQADVTRQHDVDAALADFDRLDILFNCAGIIKRGQEHDPDVFQQVLDVNLTGTMRVCAAARPALKAARGCIVNTASMLTFFGGGLVLGYAASKGGVGQLTVVGDRLRAGRHPRQRGGARLDRHAADPGAAGRPGPRRAHSGAHAAGALGHSRGCGAGGGVPVHASCRFHDGRGAAGGRGIHGGLASFSASTGSKAARA